MCNKIVRQDETLFEKCENYLYLEEIFLKVDVYYM